MDCLWTSFLGFLLQCHHNERGDVSNHRRLHCLFNHLFRRKLRKTSNLRVTCLCGGISPKTGEFPAQRASCAEIISIWWRDHAFGTMEPFYWGRKVSQEHTNCIADIVFEISCQLNPSRKVIFLYYISIVMPFTEPRWTLHRLYWLGTQRPKDNMSFRSSRVWLLSARS